MKAAHHQMPSLGCGQCQRRGLGIAHFSYQQRVGIFAQCVAQTRGETFDVNTDLTLTDQTRPGGVLQVVLDGLLERDAQGCRPPQPLLGQRCQRGALARSGVSAHQNQTVR